MLVINFIYYLKQCDTENKIEIIVHLNTDDDFERLKEEINNICEIKKFCYSEKKSEFFIKKINTLILIKKSINDILKLKPDAVCVLGGDDLAEYYDGWRIALELVKIYYISKKCSVFLVGQTIGPFYSWRKKFAHFCFKKCNIYLRDELSFDYLRKVIKLENIFVSSDLAWPDLPKQRNNSFLDYKLNKYRLEANQYITLIPSGAYKQYTNSLPEYIECWTKIVIDLVKSNKYKKLVLLSHVSRPEKKSDNMIINKIINNIDKECLKKIVVIDKIILPSEARFVLGNGIFTISGRMHGAISTFQGCKPAIVLSYSVKYAGIIGRGLNREDLLIEARGDNLWSTGKIATLVKDKVNYLLSNYNKIRAELVGDVEDNQKLALKQIEDIAKKYITKNKAAINIIGEERCAGCYGCYNKCPNEAIKMVFDDKGFIVPKINWEKCANCGLCSIACPVNNIVKTKCLQTPDVYGAWSKDENIKQSSSSGGIFTEIAKLVLSDGGMVFGVTYNRKLNQAEHTMIKSEDDLVKLRGSKYLQSNVGNSYRDVLRLIQKGKKVLFSGVPCQIAALNTFLKGNKYSQNVITCEVVCHGVPSQLAFNKYLEYLQNKTDSTVTCYDFRNKRHGWENYGTKIMFSNNEEIFQAHKKDLFMRGYLKNVYLRKSCYSCLFSKLPRVADITLGDFWGLSGLKFKEIKDKEIKNGASIVLLNTKKGIEIFSAISGIKKIKTAIDIVKKNNPRIDSFPYIMNIKKRKKFYKLLKTHNFSVVMQKITKKPSLVKKLLIILKKLSRVKK